MSNLFEYKVTEVKNGQISSAIETLKKLPNEVVKKIERGGLRKSLKPVHQDILNRAPVKDGVLKKGIKLRVKRYGEIIRGEVVSVAPHSHLVELGHRIVRNGKAFGVVEAHPYFRPGFHGKEDQVLNVVAEEIHAAIAKYEKKHGPVG